MPIIIGLLFLIVLIMLFGPLGVGLMAAVTAIGAAMGVGILVAIAFLVCAIFVGVIFLGAIGWCIAWVINPRLANEYLRDAERNAAAKRQTRR